MRLTTWYQNLSKTSKLGLFSLPHIDSFAFGFQSDGVSLTRRIGRNNSEASRHTNLDLTPESRCGGQVSLRPARADSLRSLFLPMGLCLNANGVDYVVCNPLRFSSRTSIHRLEGREDSSESETFAKAARGNGRSSPSLSSTAGVRKRPFTHGMCSRFKLVYYLTSLSSSLDSFSRKHSTSTSSEPITDFYRQIHSHPRYLILASQPTNELPTMHFISLLAAIFALVGVTAALPQGDTYPFPRPVGWQEGPFADVGTYQVTYDDPGRSCMSQPN
jgi:hypothetical protein